MLLPTSPVGDPFVSALAGSVTVDALPVESVIRSAAAVESLRPLETVTAADANESSTEVQLALGSCRLAGLVTGGASDGDIVALPSSTTVLESDAGAASLVIEEYLATAVVPVALDACCVSESMNEGVAAMEGFGPDVDARFS